jgi:nicotinamide mononucleotide (NMN) deamidase PncC
MDNQLTILIRDNLGRVLSKDEARAVAVAESQRSGLFATAFAKMAGIAPNTF